MLNKMSFKLQHRIYILHVLRIKDKQKMLSSKYFKKLETWLKCHNCFIKLSLQRKYEHFLTHWKFSLLINVH